MADLGQVVFMALALGALSFGIGILPLSIAFSRAHIAKLSTFGTGLLLGAALGVIIPEGVEALTETHTAPAHPTSRIALALLAGFALMLLLEHALGTHAHADEAYQLAATRRALDDVFDVSDPESAPPSRSVTPGLSPGARREGGAARAWPLTLGLCVHGLADGLALGVSALSTNEGDERHAKDLTLVVFLALAIHKAPTTLALTSSLLSMSITRSDCKRYISLFSTSTPVGTLVSYGLFTVLGAKQEWAALAILVSGGSFLYVATVLQPVSHQPGPPSADDVGGKTRILLITVGMIVPFAIVQLVGHGH